MKDDIVLEFGPINSSNFKSLQDIASTVRACVNTDITLTVLRNGGTRHRLLLKPQPFDGQGLVGCYFLNVENVERWTCNIYDAPGIEILTSQVLVLFWKRGSHVTFVPCNKLRWKDLFKWQMKFYVRITFCILQKFKKYENVIIPPRTPKGGWFLQNTFHMSPNNLSFEYFNFFFII